MIEAFLEVFKAAVALVVLAGLVLLLAQFLPTPTPRGVERRTPDPRRGLHPARSLRLVEPESGAGRRSDDELFDWEHDEWLSLRDAQ